MRPSRTFKVAAVRPYAARIRSQVFSALEALGGDVQTVVEAGASDDEAVATLRSTECDVLLVPFHAHRDGDGGLVHGLGLIERLRLELPQHRTTRVVCPISNVGLAAAGLMSARLERPVLERVLLLHEDTLADSDLQQQLGDFIDG